MSISDKIKGWVDYHFGTNEGVDLIAKRLNSGVERIHAYSRGEIYEFRGTGVLLSGKGNHKVYDIDFRKLNPMGFEKINQVTEFKRLTPDLWEYTRLAKLETSGFSDLDSPVEFHPVDLVVEQLRKIASRLKPEQYYLLGKYGVSMDLFQPNGYRLYAEKGIEINVPATMIGHPRLFSHADLGKTFDRANVLVLNESKIARQHRNDKDIKRWYEVRQVPSVLDRHVLRYTHRSTAHAEVFYYDVKIIIDATNQKGRPFYLTEIVKAAVAGLNSKHRSDEWHLELDYNNIQIEVAGEDTCSIDAYLNKQRNYPARVDTHPILVDDNPVVCNGYNYGYYWTVMTYEESVSKEAGKS